MLISGILGKIVNEFYNLMCIEINEIEELFLVGKIGFFIMLYKCNFVVLEGIVSLILLIFKSVVFIYEFMCVEYECDVMSWCVEWIVLLEMNIYFFA